MQISPPVTLEFLRRGPAHNQLLSPVTDYVALCGNHEPVTVHLGVEHRHVLERLRYLRYEGADEATRASSLRAMAEDMERLLSQVPGLAGELDPQATPTMLHLRLVLSASEMALLPFEMALSPAGCPSAGESLLLQSTAPLTLTREVRRMPGARVSWPRQPRILVVMAEPPGVPRIPADEHLLQIRQAIDPWIMRFSSRRARVRQVSKLLTVLPQASLERIRKACADDAYTHVHVLAHGAPVQEGVHDEYGLVLWKHDGTGREVVSGRRLAAALRAHRDDCCSEMSRPAVVTIASCDSGNQRDVITPGASLAHALHMEDIPFVVASQFPLTIPGSVVMVRVLYHRLLWGDDPRLVLHDLRQQLYQLGPKRHDWASVVAYASFPADLETQLRATRSEQARRAMQYAMARADAEAENEPHVDTKALTTVLASLQQTLDCIPDTRESGEGLLVSGVSARTEELGLRGSVEKRRARSHFELARRYRARLEERTTTALEGRSALDQDELGHGRDEALQEEARSLWAARGHYLDAFRHEMGSAWAGVQYLALSVALGVEIDAVAQLHWNIARDAAALAAVAVQADGGPQQAPQPDYLLRAWGYASLVELAALEGAGARGREGEGKAEAERAADSLNLLWKSFLHYAPKGSEEFKSTVRQLRRYGEWWSKRDGLNDHQRAVLLRVAKLLEPLLSSKPDREGGGPAGPGSGEPGPGQSGGGESHGPVPHPGDFTLETTRPIRVPPPLFPWKKPDTPLPEPEGSR